MGLPAVHAISVCVKLIYSSIYRCARVRKCPLKEANGKKQKPSPPAQSVDVASPRMRLVVLWCKCAGVFTLMWNFHASRSKLFKEVNDQPFLYGYPIGKWTH